jgi:hypothetical protein
VTCGRERERGEKKAAEREQWKRVLVMQPHLTHDDPNEDTKEKVKDAEERQHAMRLQPK